MNLPNALTLGRIFLVPLLVVVLLTEFEGRVIFGLPKDLFAAAIFGLASVTDWLDGYLARRRHQVTAFGQLLDPLADKLLISAALVSLVQTGAAAAWIVAVIIGRELAVTGLRSLAQARGVTIAASPMGKFKMVIQVGTILALILGPLDPQVRLIGEIGLWAVLIIAVVSGMDYYRRFSYVVNPKVEDFAAAAARRAERQAVARRR